MSTSYTGDFGELVTWLREQIGVRGPATRTARHTRSTISHDLDRVKMRW
jgi:hypothetical protein